MLDLFAEAVVAEGEEEEPVAKEIMRYIYIYTYVCIYIFI